jgi:hypothetical protein
MRTCCLLLLSSLAFGQGSVQQPTYQSGWPCTGKEHSFDPAYARVAEATGGHLFLFDKSEVNGFSVLAVGDMNHKQTIVRASGKTDSYVDIPFYVDSSIQSLFVIASLQCMQTIYLYDPQRASVGPANPGVSETWFQAGRIATVPKPQSGQWILRLLGTGYYSVAIQGKGTPGLGDVILKDRSLTLQINPAIISPRLRLVRQNGELLQDLSPTADTSQPGRYETRIDPPSEAFRVQVEWISETGETVERTDRRLRDGSPSQF